MEDEENEGETINGKEGWKVVGNVVCRERFDLMIVGKIDQSGDYRLSF